MCSHEKEDQLGYQALGFYLDIRMKIFFSLATVLIKQLHFRNRVGKMTALLVFPRQKFSRISL